MRDLLRKSKRIIKTCLGKDFFPKIDTHIAKERLGSEYGGWEVAIELIDKDSVVYSVGVGEDASFDLALINRYGLIIHAFDPTPKSISWVHRQDFPPNFVLHEYGVAGYDGEASFNPPENPNHVSHTILVRASTKDRSITVPVKRLATIMKELGHEHLDLLKMDIEGAEYAVVENMSRSAIRPTQLLVEFHHRFPNVGLNRTKAAIDTLRNMGYALFAVSSSGEEFCFIYKEAA